MTLANYACYMNTGCIRYQTDLVNTSCDSKCNSVGGTNFEKDAQYMITSDDCTLIEYFKGDGNTTKHSGMLIFYYCLIRLDNFPNQRFYLNIVISISRK